PVPAPTPGQLQTFAFTFQMQGYQPATINASPVNNTITITAALAPMIVQDQQQQVGPDTQVPIPVGGGRVLNVTGGGGGPIFDNHTTTGSANVDEACTIADLRVRLSGNHSFYRDLIVTLRGPGGQNYSLQRQSQQNPFRSYAVSRARGRSAQGRWVLAIEDTLRQDSGQLRAWSMTITCQ
ncbi:MAG: proprotein convertase P-domain-containing protein, partial [Sandaracinaceae bacterium]|nr:proprotein convertase P-domain-containing protein [Sandaracinaceae bacterium]